MTDLTIHGAGGGGKSSKQRTPKEAPNTLRSVSKGRILDLIAHGPIHGLVNGLQSIYLDDTPLQNPDGSFNFEGVTVHTRNGYPDQDYIPGFPAVENTISVSSEVTHELPIIRTTSNPDIDAAVVTVQVQGLTSTDAETGDINGSSVSLAIDVRPQGGAWRTVLSDTISGKTNSAYQRSYRVPMDGVPPFEIKVRRTTPDSDTARITDKLAWTTLTEVVDTKLSYPDSALVGIELDAALFGSSMPSRSYDMKLSIINVPSNYDPLTRTYTGMWDGLFKKAWTDNPAWAFYDLATDPVIGADVKNVDKWSLYQIGRYCDELVPDGYGGMEPRFTINTVFADRQDAINVLADLASVFRGMCYWGSDSLVAVGDMPADPVKLVTPANVINGEFEYSGTSLRERHSVAIVMWNDPADNYRQKPEFVEDPESIDLFGWRETQVTALGCTSRGQARRLGKWILYSERAETQTVNYSASMDHADLRPGDFIELADPDQAGARMGGRVLQAGTNTLTLDRVPEQTASDTWFLSVTMPNGSIERKQVLSFAGDTVNLLEPLSVAPLRGAVWVLTSLSVRLPIYRVTAVTEDAEKLEYKITATEHDPTKYSRVELDLVLPDLPTSYLPTGPVAPPMDIVAKAYTYLAGGVSHQAITISWTPSDDVRVVEYILEVQGPRDVSFRTVYTGAGTAFDELDADAGEWMFRLKAVSSTGRSSPWVSRTVQISNMLMPVRPDSVDVSVATFSISLFPRGAYPGAVYEFWRSATALTDAQIESNAVRLSVSTDLVDTGLRSGTQYFYYVRGSNAYGLSAWYPVQATTLEDFDDILTAMDEDIRKPGGLFEEMVGEAKTAVADTLPADVSAIVKADLDEIRASVTRAETEAAADVEEVRAEVATVRTDLTSAKAEVTLLDGVVDNLAVGVTNLEMMNELETVRYLATLALHEGSSARAVTEEVTRADQDSALSSRITTLQSEFDANKSTVTQELSTLATADQAIATRIDTLEAQVGDDIQAQINSEAITRANADSALATQIKTLETKVNTDITAAIASEATARADADTALTTQVNTAQSTANGKNKTYRQATAPTGTLVAGDLWFDTANSNKPFRYSGTAWVTTEDTRIAANTAAINSEAITRANADSALATQIKTLETKVNTDITAAISSEATARANADSALTTQVNTAQSTANGKNKTYRQATAPTGTLVAGDLWFDTANSNKPFRYSGTAWVTTEDTRIAANTAAINSEAITRANADSALALQVSTLQANFGAVGENLVTNSSFEVDSSGNGLADGWAVYNNAGISMTADRVAGRLGGFAQRVTANAATTSTHGVYANANGLSKRWVTDQWYVISFYARKVAGAAFTTCNLGWNNGPQTSTAINNPTLTTSWQRYAFKIKWNAGAALPVTSGPAFWITRAGSSAAGDALIIDDVQVQEGEVLTGYVGYAVTSAAIRTEELARASADDALSTRIDTLTSSTNDQFASVSQQFTAQTSYTDGAVARAVTTATVNGKKAVFGISVNGTVAEIGAIADRFYIYNPAGGTYTLAFAVANGQTVIQDAMIRDASIGTAKIADAAITTAKIAEAAIGSAEIKNAAIVSAKIKDGSITSAKIGNAQVDTLQLAGNSVTVPYYMQTASAISISTSWVTILTSGVVTYPEKTNVLLVCAVQTTKVSGTAVGTTETIVEVLDSSGASVLTVPISSAIIYNFSTFAGANSGAFMGNAVLNAGSYIFRVRSRAQYASPVTIYRVSLSANGVMR